MKIYIVNIEQGHPTTVVAKMNLEQALLTAKSTGNNIIKVIHGYGSSGRGGEIKMQTWDLLQNKKKNRAIKNFIKGEEFSAFNENTRCLLDLYPLLCKDNDYGKCNHGISIVLL